MGSCAMPVERKQKQKKQIGIRDKPAGLWLSTVEACSKAASEKVMCNLGLY